MYYLFILLLTSHFIGDFYLQTDRTVEGKKYCITPNNSAKNKMAKCHLWHSMLHLGLFYLALIFFFFITKVSIREHLCLILMSGIAYAISHLIIDIIKELANHKWNKKRFLFFAVDQLLHVTIILLFVIYINKAHNIIISKSTLDNIKPIIQLSLVTLGLIFLLKPTSILLINFLDLSMSNGKIANIRITKSHIAKTFETTFDERLKVLALDKSSNESEIEKSINEHADHIKKIICVLSKNKSKLEYKIDGLFDSNKAGKWIGYLERIMMFMFYLTGQFTAIAAVMAIKTAFRFNDLKDDNDSQRSEYIMIGTFFSLFCTIIVAVAVRHFINIDHFIELMNIFKSTLRINQPS